LFIQFIAASVLALLATPYLIAGAQPISEWVSQQVTGARHTAALARLSDREMREHQRRVIVVGYGPAGRAVVEELQRMELPFVVVDLNPKSVLENRVFIPIEIGDATQPEILDHLGVAHARALVITIPSPQAARTIIGQARTIAREIPILVRSRYNQSAGMLREAGANEAIDEEEMVGQELARRVQHRLGENGEDHEA
jgi:CPA2 family monovalent cation:H+ antiporter-2